MSKNFEIIDYQNTPLGEIVLQRRRILMLDGIEVFEVKLGEEWLMSSLFHTVEVALADLGLAELNLAEIDVVVGGLGLGYTAVAALNHAKVRSLVLVEALEPVIGWHKRGLVPLGEKLTTDKRCRFVHGDFFALAQNPQHGFDDQQKGRQFHAILLDIDHSPKNLLNPRHASLYEPEGLNQLAQHLTEDGVFAMWSDDPPDEEFIKKLGNAFLNSRAEVVKFYNPLQRKDSASTVYVARGPRR